MDIIPLQHLGGGVQVGPRALDAHGERASGMVRCLPGVQAAAERIAQFSGRPGPTSVPPGNDTHDVSTVRGDSTVVRISSRGLTIIAAPPELAH
eukprot:932293-Pyramimonas_sp.AAC.1